MSYFVGDLHICNVKMFFTVSLHNFRDRGRNRNEKPRLRQKQRSFLQSLIVQFPNKWTDRGRQISWPPRSPDHSQLHFITYFGSYSSVYRRYVGAHMATAELQVGCIPSYKRNNIHQKYKIYTYFQVRV